MIMGNAVGNVSVRPVRDDDRSMIFQWRNTPSLVKLGSSGREVTWDEHCAWFERVLKDDKIRLFIISSDNTPMGQVRFAKEEDAYIVTIYLIDGYTGKGIGVASLTECVKLMLKEDAHRSFIAFIKENNRASISAFSKAGFTELKDYTKTPSGHIAMRYEPGMES
ncbi:MAG: GNAT family N-acetyltransferase [Nitrospirae bacterium]|nr:GNAT family N-acetyltransferase [Nitrospirota bacterium]